MRSIPDHLPAIENTPLPERSRAGLRCIGPSCETLVIHARICDACISSAAIALCQQFEKELIDVGFTPGSNELKAALAGTASSRSVMWYERNSELGRITNREAYELRNATDIACFLVALGGVAALERMPGRPTFRSAVAAWADHHEELQQPVAAIVPRIAAVDDGAAAMARFYGSLPRVDAGLMADPEMRFDAYCLAVLIVVVFLLLH